MADCPVWPPDLFAFCASLLKRSGAYLRIFERSSAPSGWSNAHTPGRRWRTRIDHLTQFSVAHLESAVPKEVRRSWAAIVAAGSTGVADISRSPGVADHLIRLTLIADAASEGIGITIESNPFLVAAQAILEENELTSFGWDAPRDVLCVLGKQHTPQRGATLRSLSHHLSLYLPNDIEARWVGPYARQIQGDDGQTLNLLLLPWPERVENNDFQPVYGFNADPRENEARWFEYSPMHALSVRSFELRLRKALDTATRQARRIDAVVFPELALSLEQYEVAERIVFDYRAILVTGVRVPATHKRQGENLCALQPAGVLAPLGKRRPRQNRRLLEQLRLIRSKHHRWSLDRDQTLAYQLGGQICSLQNPWENIELPERVLHFVTLGNWMTWSVLICEDLARQDPAADLIRAVGPNLVIALLMDGPQLRGRWPSRYASVLAEDPGSSVLTLTSLGMAERSRPAMHGTGQRAPSRRAIALWRDVESGEHEIELDAGDNACVLSLVCRSKKEVAADGRGDGAQAHFPVFAGYRSFRTET